jgi:glycosyltransferase 2 family protein
VAAVHLSLLDGLYIMALANLVALVPAAPGYLGTFDAAVLLGVRLVAGGTHAAALAYAVVVRFVLFVPITLVGLVALVVRYGGLRRVSVALRRPAAVVPAVPAR